MSPPVTAPAAGWVTDRLDARLDGDARLADLVGLGLRRNPRRAHLLVSRVLGKHVPADPRVVHRTGVELGRAVASVVGRRSCAVLGFAETATGLGHCVAEALGAPYLHSTRRQVPGVAQVAAFEEEHSHATGHRLLPEDPHLLDADVLVLVDDELSTGRTALNTIAALHADALHADALHADALHADAPHADATHRAYVLAVLVDVRSPLDRVELARVAAGLGVPIEVVALATGTVSLPDGFAAQVAALGSDVVAHRPGAATTWDATARVCPSGVVRHGGAWPAGVRESGRHGFGPTDAAAARVAAESVAAAVVAHLVGDRALVLGTEELMYAPLLIALALADAVPDVRVSSTTRSPVLVLDEPGYPVRTGVRFPSTDPGADEPGERYAYNVDAGASDIVLVLDSDAEEPVELVAQLRRRCDRVHVVVLPCHRPLPAPLRGPEFGSYRAEEVTWLLTDLSAVALEAPTEDREEAIQRGGAHYAESLPIEYQPDAAYRRLFDQVLDASASRLAHAVGVVTELVLAERGPHPVLGSLARAGTPVGVLMRRWAAFAHGLDVPHYAISIVRGRGIDVTALRYLAAHHRPADVVFVDGWTGKGAIARELLAAVTEANAVLGTDFDPALAVLADPGCCVSTFGTREDFLVPSACLNSTVSGLVSRTVRNDRLLRPGQYDGAKFYRGLVTDDVSARFVDAVSERFADVAAAVRRDWPALQAGDRRPTWSGWTEVERLSEQYGIGDVTLVKPGVGETTRVLLRRVPWAVLVRPDAGADIEHVLLLARRRGVPVHEVADLRYRCVGLIHPRFTRGATGAAGTAAR